jgi:precorrin-3B synthase
MDDSAQAAEIVTRLTRAFLERAARFDPPARRMRALVEHVGATAIFAAAGLPVTTTIAGPAVPNAIGWLPYLGHDRGAFGVGLPFGSTDSTTLSALADIAARHGDGTLRLTPWRVLVIPGVVAPAAIRDDLVSLDVITEADDPRARLFACPGAPACASAAVPARADAARLAAIGFRGTIHVSGCAKGCAHPAIADVTLVGEGGGYTLIRHGRAGDSAERSHLAMSEVMAILHADGEGAPA